MRGAFCGVLLLLLAAISARAEDRVAVGQYLTILGDCAACHTPPGGAPFSGGRRIPTPFGWVIAPNLTFDRKSGLGLWSAADFDRALRFGRKPDGGFLYPAHPYPYFARFTAEESAAIRAYLATLAPVYQPARGADLPFPFDFRVLLWFWNALYVPAPPPLRGAGHDALWDRGAWIANGPGHCGACHTPKTLLGGDDLARAWQGGMAAGWLAPALDGDPRTGLGAWREAEIAQFLATGAAHGQLATGPMAEVITLSTAQMTKADRAAIAHYLKTLPQSPGSVAPAPPPAMMAAGEALYRLRCAPCHGRDGEGTAGLFPRLAGSAIVQAPQPATILRVVREGTRAVATKAAPTGPAMPGFAGQLDDGAIAAIATYIRNSWGNAAPAVSEAEARR